MNPSIKDMTYKEFRAYTIAETSAERMDWLDGILCLLTVKEIDSFAAEDQEKVWAKVSDA